MPFEHYIFSGTKRLRCGYTTGSCAALAAKAATTMLLGKAPLQTVAIATPAGICVEADVLDVSYAQDSVCCAVQKDAGDDVDVTDGMLVYAMARCVQAPGVQLLGGQGVGRVTKPGLEQPVGAAAINSVPREMVCRAVQESCAAHAYTGGIEVTISVPGGAEAARKTFNPNLGIEGGISILGTTGIVEPKSVAALLDSIELEIRQRAACGAKALVLTPGNYGCDFIKVYPRFKDVQAVCCSNFIGDALDFAARYGFEQVLLVGHIGKLVKLAGGIMNTHSRMADCRAELFCAHAALAGANGETMRSLMQAATTDACIGLLEQSGQKEGVLQSLAAAIEYHMERRIAGAYAIGAVVFSNKHGFLCQTPSAEAVITFMEEHV